MVFSWDEFALPHGIIRPEDISDCHDWREERVVASSKETRWAGPSTHPSAPLAKLSSHPAQNVSSSNTEKPCRGVAFEEMPQHPLLTSFSFYLLTFDGSKKKSSKNRASTDPNSCMLPWLIFTQSLSHVCKILKCSVNAGSKPSILCKEFYIIKNLTAQQQSPRTHAGISMKDSLGGIIDRLTQMNTHVGETGRPRTV